MSRRATYRPVTCRRPTWSKLVARPTAVPRDAAAEVSDGLPGAGGVPRDLFGICVVGTEGAVYAAGDADHEFTIMSVSKPFVFALVCEALGAEKRASEIGVNAHGPAVQLGDGHRAQRRRPHQPDGQRRRDRHHQPRAGRHGRGKWRFDPRRPVALRRPRADARRGGLRARRPRRTTATRASPGCSQSFGRIYSDPAEATDLYTRQCSLHVTARDLAVMGATLADGGVNPLPGAGGRRRGLPATRWPSWRPPACTRPPATGSTTSGCPARAASAAASSPSRPARAGSGTFAPPLDPAGNSVKGQLAARFLSERTGTDLFVSKPEA